LEQVGFLNALDDNFHGAERWRRSISRICIAFLRRRIESDYIKSDEISFSDILNFNDAVISDIDELLDLGMGIEDFEYIDSLEDIKASYETINEILGQYR
jgi:hypothetical protein